MIGKLPARAVSSRFTLQSRKREVERKLQSLSDTPETAAIVRLLFYGGPVLDSRAIDASFAASVINNYQDLITKASAAKKGTMARCGPIADAFAEGSRFNLTGIERGSFGFALEEKTVDASTPIFDTALKEVVEEVSEMMEGFCNSSDEDYITLVESMDRRLFASYKSFFSLLFKSDAQIKVDDSSHHERKLDAGMIAKAFGRVEATQTDEESIEVRGLIQGLTPYSNVFDFLSENSTKISGKVSPSFSADYREQINQGDYIQAGRFLVATLIKKTTTNNLSTRTSYTLIGLTDANLPTTPTASPNA